MNNREILKQKVMDRASEIIETYSHSAERGVAELEKEALIIQTTADNTEVAADERIINLMLKSVILSVYAFELTIIPCLKEQDEIKESTAHAT